MGDTCKQIKILVSQGNEQFKTSLKLINIIQNSTFNLLFTFISQPTYIRLHCTTLIEHVY